MSTRLRVGPGRRSGRRFDAQHNVVTEALLFLGELDPERIGGAIDDATHYEPTPLGQFDEVLRALDIDYTRFSFVDVGAGLGRVLLLASRVALKQVIGIEVSAALCETARDNVLRWRREYPDLACRDVRVVGKNVLEARFPPGNVVFYLYNPFGATTLHALVERIVAQCEGEVRIAYHTPVHRAVLDEHRSFEIVQDLGHTAIYAMHCRASRDLSVRRC